MPSFLTIPPNVTSYRLANACVPVCLVADASQLKADADGLAPCDIVIEKERIAAISPAAAANDGLPNFDLARGIVLPRLVDVHTHVDKGHIWQRAPNPDGTFMGARMTVMADREANWSRDDVAKRMDFSLRCSFAHGTGALRTHIDSIGKQTAISWGVFAEMREQWKGRITLQARVALSGRMGDRRRTAIPHDGRDGRRHGGALGGLTFLGEAPTAKLDAALDRVFEAANANGLDLDFHVDESDSPLARTLPRIADAALRQQVYRAASSPGIAARSRLPTTTSARPSSRRSPKPASRSCRCRCATCICRIAVAGRTPRWRGVAPLHELAAAGVTVMVASDNTRDPFYAYGDLDMLEVYREATRILHFDHSDRPWLKTVAATPGEVMRLPHGRMAVGAPAGLVLTRARTMNELLSRPQTDRVVLCAGRQVDRHAAGLPGAG